MNFLRKKPNIEVQNIDPTTIIPTDALGFINRGYAFHARGEFLLAEEDIRKALTMDSTLEEAHYALSLNLKAQNRRDEAIESFQKALERMPTLEKANPIRAHMLTRIIKGHINQLTKGNWDLRNEFWGNGGE
jgi:tetratricopeptide (TPR) repeat protein